MATTGRKPPQFDDDLHVIAAAQRLELAAAQSTESDLDLAFHLQMQEALSASLSLQPGPSTSSPAVQIEESTSSSALQAEYLDKFALERHDQLLAEAEMQRAKEELRLRAHDAVVAAEILRIPDDEWEETGDHFHRPFVKGSGEGSSKGTVNSVNCEFRVYCKGLVSDESMHRGKSVVLAGIGVAICDSVDGLVFEMRKPVVGAKSRQVVELKAVIEGLSAALSLDLKRVVFYYDYYPLYKYVTGRWTPKQQKLVTLVNHIKQLCGKFEHSAHSLVARNDVKFAFKFAREAIVAQINKPLESSSVKNMNETCDVCLEDKDVAQFFTVENCSHRYCFSCMKQHVEVKLLHGIVPKCPHENCNTELKIESCRKFLTPKLIEMMTHRLKEASIPVTEKVYCPYPRCSFLMTKTEVLEYSMRIDHINRTGRRTCLKCENLFCVYCKVPWHYNMNCQEYKRRNPHPPAEDVKLKTLANRNLWRQCIKCNHMIELDTGCYHMTCRCGYEFCYTCGAEWKNKKALCSCPLWDEDYILDDDYESDEEELYDYDDEDDYESDSDDYY